VPQNATDLQEFVLEAKNAMETVSDHDECFDVNDGVHFYLGWKTAGKGQYRNAMDENETIFEEDLAGKSTDFPVIDRSFCTAVMKKGEVVVIDCDLALACGVCLFSNNHKIMVRVERAV